MNVADFELGKPDKYGLTVSRIFARKPPEYCVYVADQRVQCCFADASEVGKDAEQRKALSALAPLRGEIDGLLDGWREGTNRTPIVTRRGSDGLRAKAELYNRRVADALIVALEGDVTAAVGILDKVKQDILDERVARARFEYLIAAVLSALILMFLGWLITATYPMVDDKDYAGRAARVAGILLLYAALAGIGIFYVRMRHGAPRPANIDKDDEDGRPVPVVPMASRIWQAAVPSLLLFFAVAIPLWAMLRLSQFSSIVVKTYPVSYADSVTLWRAAAAGTVGAFFSIAIGIRGRTVLPDLRRQSNLMDAALRVTIGCIGGAVLMALLILKVVVLQIGSFSMNNTTLVGVLVAGFLAGFSERLVPDLLDKASAKPGMPPPPPPAPPVIAKKKDDDPADGGGKKPDSPDAPDTDPLPDEAHDDGCASDHEVEDDQVMHDADLPAASGGVAPENTTTPTAPVAPPAPASGGPTS